MGGKWFACLAMAGLVAVFADETKIEKEIGKGEIVAKVNGVPLYEKDVYLGMSQDPAAGPEIERYRDKMVEEAIKQELLYQEAKKQGLDKDPSYNELVFQMRQQAEESEVKELAKGLEFEKLSEYMDKIRNEKASSDEITNYRKEHSEQFANMPEEQTNNIIEGILKGQKSVRAYNTFMKDMLSKTEVRINEKVLPQDVLITTTEYFSSEIYPYPTTIELLSGLSDIAIKSQQPPEVLFPKVVELAGGKESKSKADELKVVRDAIVTIGDSSFRLGNCSRLSLLLNPPPAMLSSIDNLQINRDLPLFMTFKNYILAEEVKRLILLDKSFKWNEPKGRPTFFIEHGFSRLKTIALGQDHEWTVLVNLLMEKLGLDDFKKIQLSHEEIDQYYEKNPEEKANLKGEFFSISRDMYAKTKIYTQKVKEYVDNLWRSANIEILEPPKTKEVEIPGEE